MVAVAPADVRSTVQSVVAELKENTGLRQSLALEVPASWDAFENALSRVAMQRLLDGAPVAAQAGDVAGTARTYVDLLRSSAVKADTTPVGPKTYVFDHDTLVMGITVLSDRDAVATVRGLGERPVRVQLRAEHGRWSGSTRDVQVTVHDKWASPSVSLTTRGRTEGFEIAATDIGPFNDLLDTTIADACHRLFDYDATNAAPAQLDALRGIAGLAVGPTGTLLDFVHQVVARPALTAAEAACAPLLYTWFACQPQEDLPVHNSAQQLSTFTANLSSIADVAQPAVAELLHHALAEPSLHRLQVATLAAARMTLEPTTSAFDALLFGVQTLARNLRDYKKPLEMARTYQAIWQDALPELAAQLPDVSAARQRMQKLIDEVRTPDPLQACNLAALGMGAICHILDHGSAPDVSDAGMPRLSPWACMQPVHALRSNGGLGADAPRVSDVGQSDDVGNCYNAVAWMGIARARPERIAQIIEQRGTGRYTVGFARGEPVQLDNRLYVDRYGKPVFGANRDGTGERLWWPLIEAGYCHIRSEGDAHYQALDYGNTVEVFDAAFGENTGRYSVCGEMTPEQTLELLVTALRDGLPITASSRPHASRRYGLVPNHGYEVAKVEPTPSGPRIHVVDPHPPRLGARTLFDDMLKLTKLQPGGRPDHDAHVLSLEDLRAAMHGLTWASLPPKVTAESCERAGLA